MYTTGWIKRGPVGLIGHTKGDANETIACLLEDFHAGKLNAPSDPSTTGVTDWLDDHDTPYTTWDGWYRLDEHERARLQPAAVGRRGRSGRPRISQVSRGPASL